MTAPNRADEKAAFVKLFDDLDQMAAMRRDIESVGQKLPRRTRRSLIAVRSTLLQAGLTPAEIDTTPAFAAVWGLPNR